MLYVYYNLSRWFKVFHLSSHINKKNSKHNRIDDDDNESMKKDEEHTMSSTQHKV